MAWRDRQLEARGLPGVRLVDYSLQQIVELAAADIAQQTRPGRQVRLVLRDKHGFMTRAGAQSTSSQVTDPSDAMYRPALMSTLDSGVASHNVNAIVLPITVQERTFGAVVVAAVAGQQVDAAEGVAAGAVIDRWVFTLDNALALADALTRASNLERAMETRSIIEQAKGVLIAANGCSADHAFRLLRERSQRGNIKLAAVAAQIVIAAADSLSQLDRFLNDAELDSAGSV